MPPPESFPASHASYNAPIDCSTVPLKVPRENPTPDPRLTPPKGRDILQAIFLPLFSLTLSEQTTSEHYLPLWGMKPTVLDQCNLLDLHTLPLTH